MPTKADDRHQDEGSVESKDRKKHRVKVTRTKSGEKVRKLSTDRLRDAERERERSDLSNSERGSITGSTSTASKRRVSAPVSGNVQQASLNSMEGSRVSLPYPAFSKAHSREAVGSKERLDSTNTGRNTPEASEQKSKSRKKSGKDEEDTRNPPSPPLTVDDEISVLEERKRKLEKQGEEIKQRLDDARKEGSRTQRSSIKLSSNGSLRETKTARKHDDLPRRTVSHNSARPKGYRYRPHVPNDDNSSRSRSSSPSSRQTDSVTKPTVASSVGSDATQKAARQMRSQMPHGTDAGHESSPARTPTPRGNLEASRFQQHTPYESPQLDAYQSQSRPSGFSEASSMPPPPPPPPPLMSLQPPRVDYLMQNGGLSHGVPKQYLDIIDQEVDRPFSSGDLPNTSLMAQQVQKLFKPFSDLLDNYSRVMEKNGSLAVATGYRSIARRLLDRLEAVFARDISSEICVCAMCEHQLPPDQDELDSTGISWGEILEFVSGRRELPPWPPFALSDSPDPESVGLGILETPMQKLDIDVPEEYREHYIKQSKKTKSSVDRWLAGQATEHAAPDDADDDTLTFAMLTRLDDVQRLYFKKLLGVSDTRPPSVQPSAAARAQTPLNAPKSPLMTRTGFALQRLYRLTDPPRSPECACYLVRNPSMHNILATLAAVSDHEWDILTSGRFDGFLWSGAEDQPSSVPPSRGPTPAFGGRTSRGPTPAPRPNTPVATGLTGAGGAPVALDEETEIAVLAEVERDIYLGMEALEDAFEVLHQRAEAVRAVMRARGAGLSMAQAARRGATADTIEARLGTPASQMGTLNRGQWDGNGDLYDADGNDDGTSVFGADWRSELAPDDSASNISGVRKFRRKKRGEERRTPAPIEEEGEEDPSDRNSKYKERDRHNKRR